MDWSMLFFLVFTAMFLVSAYHLSVHYYKQWKRQHSDVAEKRDRESVYAQEMHDAPEQILRDMGARILILQQLLDLMLEETKGFQLSESFSAELKSQFHDFPRWEDTGQEDLALQGVNLKKVRGKPITLFVHKQHDSKLLDEIHDMINWLQDHGHSGVVDGFRIAACRIFQLELMLHRLLRQTKGVELPKYLQEHLTTQFEQRPKLRKSMLRLGWSSSVLTSSIGETGDAVSFDEAWSMIEEEIGRKEELNNECPPRSDRFLPGVPGKDVEQILSAAPGDEIGTGKFDHPDHRPR